MSGREAGTLTSAGVAGFSREGWVSIQGEMFRYRRVDRSTLRLFRPTRWERLCSWAGYVLRRVRRWMLDRWAEVLYGEDDELRWLWRGFQRVTQW